MITADWDLPGGWSEKLDLLQRIAILPCPDKVTEREFTSLQRKTITTSL